MSDHIGPAITRHRRSAEQGPPQHGAVKWFNPEKGYGFIVPDSSPGTTLFLHARACEDSGIEPSEIQPGDRLIYLVGTDRSGRPNAYGIQRE
jgi:cold shock protein